MRRVGVFRVSAMTQTPASGPREPVTTPPMSSASMAGGATVDVCWPAASRNVVASPTPANTRSFDRIGHLLSLRAGPHPRAVLTLSHSLPPAAGRRRRREAYNDRRALACLHNLVS